MTFLLTSPALAANFSKLIDLSKPIRLLANGMYFPLPQPASKPIAWDGIEPKNLEIIGQGLYLVEEKWLAISS